MKIFLIVSIISILNLAISATKSDFKIVLIYNGSEESTSTSNIYEQHNKDGFNFAIDEFGKNRQLKYYWVDGGESSKKILSAFEEIKKIRPDIIVGPSHSFQVLLLSKLLLEENIGATIITPTATSSELTKLKNVFMMSNSNDIQAKLIVNQIKISNENLKNLVVTIQDCIYCKNFSDEIKSQLKKNNLNFKEKLVSQQSIDLDLLGEELSNFQNIIIPALEVDTSKVIGALFSKNTKTNFWGGDGAGTLARYVIGLNLKNLNFCWLSHYHLDINTTYNKSKVKSFISKYKKEPIDTSMFYYESLKFGVKYFYDKTKESEFILSTGKATINNNQIKRPMPLLCLKNNKPYLKKVID